MKYFITSGFYVALAWLGMFVAVGAYLVTENFKSFVFGVAFAATFLLIASLLEIIKNGGGRDDDLV